MKYVSIVFFLSVAGALLALPQAPTTTTGAKKKTVTTKSASSTKTAAATKTSASATAHKSSTKTASAKTTASSRKGKSAKRPAAVTAARTRQLTPTPERYKEIQQALADKGYLKSEPNGVWDADSTEALRQFQTDKNLTPTGKITAASLIGLGLGPKPADTVAAPPLPAPDPAGSASAAQSAN